MAALKICDRCSHLIPAGAPAGQCPVCLLRLGLASTPGPEDTAAGGDSASTGHFSGQYSSPSATGPYVPGGGPGLGPVVLGNLELRGEIGHGGMGVVYRAWQRVADREVAVKVLADSRVGRRGAADRFAAEVAALAGLRHPNVVEVYEVGEADGCVYFSMPLMPGGSLAARLKGGPVDPAEAAAVVERVADAAHAAHAAGLLHRDIKPANVLLDADGSPRLSDFGLAKWVDREDGLTETGAVVGTPSHMAPEQAAGSKRGTLGPATDVYGLGATLYELLTGRPPFREASTFETLQRVMNDPPVPPRQLNARVHPILEAICLKCLEKDPARRYRSARALAEDLARFRAGEPTTARPPSRARRAWRFARRRARWFAATGVAAAFVALTIILAMRWPRPEKREPPAEEQIAEALDRRDPVTLVGEGGAPRYFRWVVGTGNANPASEGGPFLVFAKGSALLELVPDTRMAHYRLSAEFQMNESVSPDGEAGVFFAHRPRALGPGLAADRAVIVQLSEDLINYRPRYHDSIRHKDYDLVAIQDALFFAAADGGIRRTTPAPVGNLRVFEEGNDPHFRPWRQVVVTVDPDRIEVLWRNRDGSYRPVAVAPATTIPTAALEDTAGRHRRHVRLERPDVDPGDLAPYSPRGGAGLYVRDARVFFRNVVLEPLPETPAP